MDESYLLKAFDEVWKRKGAFLGIFFVVFSVSYGVLFAIDFIPEKPESDGVAVVEEAAASTAPDTAAVLEVVDPYPVRLKIESLGTDVLVLNPESREIAALDEALLKGVVRHPDSADFSETGTMVLFGHSSYLPTVHNRNYQAFNGIQKLIWGDMVRVESGDTAYIYRVKKVYKAQASAASVALSHKENMLILVTCNSFGSKDDRFVVEAELIEKEAL